MFKVNVEFETKEQRDLFYSWMGNLVELEKQQIPPWEEYNKYYAGKTLCRFPDMGKDQPELVVTTKLSVPPGTKGYCPRCRYDVQRPVIELYDKMVCQRCYDKEQRDLDTCYCPSCGHPTDVLHESDTAWGFICEECKYRD